MFKLDENYISSFKKIVNQICENATVEEGITHNVSLGDARVTDMTDIGRVQMNDIVSLACSWRAIHPMSDSHRLKLLYAIVVGKSKGRIITKVVIHQVPEWSMYTIDVTVSTPLPGGWDDDSSSAYASPNDTQYTIHVFEQEAEFTNEFDNLLWEKAKECMDSAMDWYDMAASKKLVIESPAGEGTASIAITYGYGNDADGRDIGVYTFLIGNAEMDFKTNKTGDLTVISSVCNYRDSRLYHHDLSLPRAKIVEALKTIVRSLIHNLAVNDQDNSTGFNTEGLFSKTNNSLLKELANQA